MQKATEDADRDIGEMAEWSNALVLKTSEGHTSGGSNPSFSARFRKPCKYRAFRNSKNNRTQLVHRLVRKFPQAFWFFSWYVNRVFHLSLLCFDVFLLHCIV